MAANVSPLPDGAGLTSCDRNSFTNSIRKPNDSSECKFRGVLKLAPRATIPVFAPLREVGVFPLTRA